MSNDAPNPNAIKSYIIGTDHVNTQKILEIQHNSIPILWAVKEFKTFKGATINITSDGDGVNILAAVRTIAIGGGVRVMLGDDPDVLPKEEWAEVLPEGMSGRQHGFEFDGRGFWWRRTHNPAYGASSHGGMDFKLVDEEERALAVFIKDMRFLHIEEIGRIDYFVELGRELELFSLAAILGIQYRIRRSRN